MRHLKLQTWKDDEVCQTPDGRQKDRRESCNSDIDYFYLNLRISRLQ